MENLDGKCVALGVTGGIAAYKMANVASRRACHHDRKRDAVHHPADVRDADQQPLRGRYVCA